MLNSETSEPASKDHLCRFLLYDATPGVLLFPNPVLSVRYSLTRLDGVIVSLWGEIASLRESACVSLVHS